MGNVKFVGQYVEDYNDDGLSKLLQWYCRCEDMSKPRLDTLTLWVGILRAFDDIGIPMTVRQMFYALTTRGLVEKTEQGYKRVAYRLLQTRRLGIIPYDFIADSTRWMRKPKTYESLADFLRESQNTYRHSLWMDRDEYVEIWIEKDALAGVVYEITAKWDVPLMVTRGFPSETFVYEAAQNVKEQGKLAYLYYFGDYDPSGMAISDDLSDRLRKFGVDAFFERVAVVPSQIVSMNLPTRPTKRSDTRSRNWRGGSVELDAIPANVLREMVEDCITQHIDEAELERIKRIESLERETLATVVKSVAG